MTVLVFLNVYGLNAVVQDGNQIYGNETMTELEIHGTVLLNGTKVTKRLLVYGKLEAHDAEIEKMEIYGEAVLDHCLVQKKSTVHGKLRATDSTFAKELSVAAHRIALNACTLHGLRILKSKGRAALQIVELKEGTVVDGPVIFEGRKGEITMDRESEITGKVIGGKPRV